MDTKKIPLHDVRSFTSRFMPSGELDSMLREGFGKFFIVKVENMYRLVKGPVPPSRSTTHSCIYLTQGEATMNIGSRVYTIGKDEMLFVPAGQVFSFRESDVNKGYLCNFHSDMLAGKFGGSDLLREFEFLRIWGNPKLRLDRSTSLFVRHIFSRMLFDYVRNGLRNLDIIQPYLITLLCEANRAYTPVVRSGKAAAVTIANRFNELVFAHFRSRRLVSEYAALLNITPNHLNKTIKAVTGKSPTQWINEAIVLEAKVLLGQSALSVSEIALEVGFDDPSYFARLFRKCEGITPSEFRRKIESP